MRIAVFVDYDNLLAPQKSAGLLDLLIKLLSRLSLDAEGQSVVCDARIYGGWYEGPDMTKRAQQVSAAAASDFPVPIRVHGTDGSPVTVLTSADLAFSLLEEPAWHVFDTYRRKGRPGNVRVASQGDLGCQTTECPLPVFRKLLKHGSCPHGECVVKAEDVIYRHEQKIVDSMLTCDVLYAVHLRYDHIVVVSADDDFLPAIRTVLLRGTPVTRFHPKASGVRASFSRAIGAFTELDL